MLRWMCGVTRKDKIRNEHIRGTTRVAQASKDITERRLNWYGHVMRRDGEHIMRKVLKADIPGKRKRGRPKTRCKDACQRDLKKYWTESGRGDEQGDVEKKDHQLYRRPYMMGKARGKEEEAVVVPNLIHLFNKLNSRLTQYRSTLPCWHLMILAYNKSMLLHKN